MADNVGLNIAGTGPQLAAADEVVDGTLGTVKVQFIKIMDGTLDGTTKAAVGTNGLNVVQNATAVAGGITTTTRLLSAAATTNATSAKGSAGRLYSIQGYNAAAAIRYLKLYNKATAPTVGTDTPVKTIALPAGAAFALDWPIGYSFATGIAYALTALGTDADTTALAAGDIIGLNLDYV